MAFFEKLGETIATTGKAAGQKAKDAADLAKLNAQLGQMEGKIKSWYQVIGEKVYQSEKDQDHAGLETEFDMINNAFAEIGTIKKQIADIRGVKLCQECGAEMAKDSLFCSKCGAKIEEPVPEPVPEEEGAAVDVVEDEPAAEEEPAAESESTAEDGPTAESDPMAEDGPAAEEAAVKEEEAGQ